MTHVSVSFSIGGVASLLVTIERGRAYVPVRISKEEEVASLHVPSRTESLGSTPPYPKTGEEHFHKETQR